MQSQRIKIKQDTRKGYSLFHIFPIYVVLYWENWKWHISGRWPCHSRGGELRTAHRKYQMRENIQNVPLIKEVMVRADLKLHQEISVGWWIQMKLNYISGTFTWEVRGIGYFLMTGWGGVYTQRSRHNLPRKTFFYFECYTINKVHILYKKLNSGEMEMWMSPTEPNLKASGMTVTNL